MTPCHREKYDEAMRGIASMFPRLQEIYGQDMMVQPWMRAAMEQHAHYYAVQACGEKNMDFGNTMRARLGIPARPNTSATPDVLTGGVGVDLRARALAGYGAWNCQSCSQTGASTGGPDRPKGYNGYAALGITRVGDGRSGIIRNISMAGFGGAETDRSLYPDKHQCDKASFQTMKDNGGPGWSAYCECMFPEGSKGRQACYEVAAGGYFGIGSLKPWSCEGKLAIEAKLIAAGAPPNVFETPQERQYCLDVVVGKVKETIDTAKQYIPATGTAPAADTGTGPSPDTGTTPATGTGTTPVVGRSRSADRIPNMDVVRTLFPTEQKKDNTMLYAGLGVAVIAALFLLKK